MLRGMTKISRIILCSIVILSAISLKPAVSEAAWWKPATWFNNWSFDVPSDQPIDTGNTPNPTQTSVQTTLVAPTPKPAPKITPPPTNVPPKNSLNQLRTAVSAPVANKSFIVSVKPRSAASTTEVSIYGSDFEQTGQNYIVLTDKKYDTLSLNNATSEIEILARTASSSSKITFNMSDVPAISAGTYDLYIRHSSGTKSNSVKFTVTETKVICPAGYECALGTSEETQIDECPTGYVCTMKADVKLDEVLPENDTVIEDVKKETLN
jgi:hypothetical protein